MFRQHESSYSFSGPDHGIKYEAGMTQHAQHFRKESTVTYSECPSRTESGASR